MDENNPLRDFFASILSAVASIAPLPREDHQPKSIGDKVIMLDINNMKYVCDFDTGKPVKDMDDEHEVTDEAMVLFAQGYIVAEIDVQHIYKCQYCPNDHVCDTVIYSPDSKKKYYTNLTDIKVVE